ncbi:alanyl-tRNA editing protein [Shimia marina]|uniref:Alanine--tRNA ligase n=1 Tax=Shimia marina TaxID=321267 RepID=A0A0N7LSH7_9RHOB|nr:alanyl-tRNA editing protein [Shimia marina]CUH53652.1 Alanine--tRNA ligase [Shimia marina]SFD71956.1 Ala-tRNA(Pro) hydrolase [Shimia marina]
MTELLFLKDAYMKEAIATVVGHTPEGGILLDATLFYATSGGQPGDSGHLSWNGQQLEIATTVKTAEGGIALVPSEPAELPAVGTEVMQVLNWARRHRHMRVHTALHLLSVVIPLPVTGGSIGTEKGRLDFDMPEAPEDKAALTEALNALIAEDHAVSEQWITDAELEANPGLVKTMSVAPPKGAGKVRLVRIGSGDHQVDLQPCGGTHVASIGEIGPVRIGKIEKKGRQNRRVYLHLE